MTYSVEIEFNKIDYDAFRGKRYPILEWLVKNFGSSMAEDAKWDSNIDYKRSPPSKLLVVYSFKNSYDAMLFKLRWS